MSSKKRTRTSFEGDIERNIQERATQLAAHATTRVKEIEADIDTMKCQVAELKEKLEAAEAEKTFQENVLARNTKPDPTKLTVRVLPTADSDAGPFAERVRVPCIVHFTGRIVDGYDLEVYGTEYSECRVGRDADTGEELSSEVVRAVKDLLFSEENEREHFPEYMQQEAFQDVAKTRWWTKHSENDVSVDVPMLFTFAISYPNPAAAAAEEEEEEQGEDEEKEKDVEGEGTLV
jgi:hypothetical protein